MEKKEGSCTYKGHDMMIIDLPGVYSLTAYSPDEIVVRNFIIEDRPDVVVDVVDASNLERNLYLSVQIMEMNVPFILAMNMMDKAASKGYRIDMDAISREMGVPVIPMIANRGNSTDDLLDMILRIVDGKIAASGVKIQYGREVEAQVSRLEKVLSGNSQAGGYSPRWLAVKLIEGDEEIMKKFGEVQRV